MRNQKGFTLIELIIVIVVLGILAVTAAPQFFNFSGDARESAVKGLKGNIQGAYQTVYAKAAVDGDFSTAIGDVTIANGYPTATADGIVKAASLDSSEWVSLVDPDDPDDPDDSTVIYIGPAGYIGNNGAAVTDFTEIGGTADNGCYVSYQQTDSADTPPTVAIDVSGCGN
ncbi:type II secretion system protein [Idiomarina baltica]|uniref:type II secretion system protein n=1 Tax=Idiomarina baltica TaxID=190892 RepID=UPI000C48EC86|nr:type II secretion system protein [Idiomarina baltica]MBL74219.1 Type II secretory pathway, pseudopilin [Idiomarinaceae bacterium]